MLKEIKNVKQDRSGFFRRWFSDEYSDLIVWLGPEGRIRGFQLCYEISNDEHSLTWTRKDGFAHHRIDDGDVSYSIKRSPVLVMNGPVPIKKTTKYFKENSKDIDQKIAHFIIHELKHYPK